MTVASPLCKAVTGATSQTRLGGSTARQGHLRGRARACASSAWVPGPTQRQAHAGFGSVHGACICFLVSEERRFVPNQMEVTGSNSFCSVNAHVGRGVPSVCLELDVET